MAFQEEPTARHLVEAGLVSERDLDLMEGELSQADSDLGGHCPLDAERLRSGEAVEAYARWPYVIVRALGPRTVVETGVQNGCSTEMILWAIHRNGHGRLLSIDSGSTSSDGAHQTQWHSTTDGVPGKEILAGLKARWDLTIGLTRDCLAAVCGQAGEIDVFWHDSDHSEENVRREFGTARRCVRAGGLLALHDFHGQDVTLDERAYRLVVPVQEPYLPVWRKEEPDARARGGSV